MSLKWSSVTDQLYAVSNSSPSLDLDFAANKTLDDNISGNNLITFSRASSGTYVGSDGLIKTSPVNLLYDTTTYFNWVPSGQSIQTNAAISPSGSNDAVKLVANASAGEKILYRSVTTTATNVCSIYAKAGEYTNIQLRELSAARFYVNFDLSSGTYVAPQSGSAPAGGFDFISADIQDVGNGWYRCSVVNSRIGGLALSVAGYPDSETGTASLPNFTGDGTSGVLLWGAQVEEGTTATTYIPTTTTIGGAPRFDHDPVTLQSLGLLIEEERTNLITNSAGDTVQTIQNMTGPVSVDGPAGSGTAYQYLSVGGTVASRLVIGTVNVTTSSQYTATIYVKGVNYDTVTFGFSGTGFPSQSRRSFDLDTLTSQSSGSGAAETSIEDVGNGWRRLRMTSVAANANATSILYLDLGGTSADTHSTNEGFQIYGIQVEAGSFPTSYIPTSGSAVPREADVATIEGTNFSSWYNQSEGTVFAEADSFSYDNSSTLPTYAHITDGTLNNYIRVNSGPAYKVRNFTQVGGVNQGQQNTGGAPANNVVNSIAVAIAQNNSAIVADGVSFPPDTSYLVPTVTKMEIGNWIAQNDTYLNGHISRLTYYPYRLSDTILQEITS